MSQKNVVDSNQVSTISTATKQLPQYTKPKILLIDIDPSATEMLQMAGYNVSSGSFGKLYSVEKSDGFTPVISNGSLPENFTENDVVIIDLAISEILSQAQGQKATTPGQIDWWVSASSGIVDPRPRLMVSVQDDMKRILSHSRLFIVFASPRIQQELMLGHVYGSRFVAEKSLDYDNWCFLELFQPIDIKPDNGKEITVIEDESPLTNCLRAHINNAHFDCTLVEQWKIETRTWISLAKNKYDDDVAAAILLGDPEKPRYVFLFPQLHDKPRFITQLIQEVLPGIAPHLFPDVEGAKWVQRREYEF